MCCAHIGVMVSLSTCVCLQKIPDNFDQFLFTFTNKNSSQLSVSTTILASWLSVCLHICHFVCITNKYRFLMQISFGCSLYNSFFFIFLVFNFNNITLHYVYVLCSQWAHMIPKLFSISILIGGMHVNIFACSIEPTEYTSTRNEWLYWK